MFTSQRQLWFVLGLWCGLVPFVVSNLGAMASLSAER